LAWLLEHKQAYEDPLQRVEEVYADFGYPETIRHLVRYMPAGEASTVLETGEARLYREWEAYVRACSLRLQMRGRK
jgi:hypothetical protein